MRKCGRGRPFNTIVMRHRAVVSFLGCVAFAVSALPDDARAAELRDVSVRLFLLETGDLSPNILGRPYFVVRNFTVFADDDLNGKRSESFVVDLEFSNKEETFLQGHVALVELRGHESGVVLRSDSVGDLYIPNSGTAHVVIHYPSQLCQARSVRVTAFEFDKTYSLPFSCGE